MDLYNQKDKSYPQKIFLTTLELIIIMISYWILFANGYDKLFRPVNPVTGNHLRHIILFVFNIVVFMRILVTTFCFIKRKMPWEEAVSITFAFALYYLGFALFGYKSDLEVGVVEIIAIMLFLLGSFLNTGSELARDTWKRKPENKGHLYTVGLFRYSMHINYFGDLLWVSAYALLTRNWYSISIPVFLFCFFAFFNIPKLDNYLRSKYGDEFDDYQRSTKKFIPIIY
jgi:protein-S-isoprenylcysteine O-methyltransferase Ste14